MCGIAAILLRPEERTPEQWQFIKNIFTQNLIFNQDRGKSASGLAVVQRDGSAEVAKLPLQASEFVETSDYKTLLETLGPQTVLLLGHARDPTKGPPENSNNNHPILTGHTLGAHNGHINNDDRLFAEYGWERNGQVDSEVIFRLLDTAYPNGNDALYADAVRERAHKLDGAFATISVDLRNPTRILILKYNRPLCIHNDPSNGIFHFSSRYIFLRKAFGRSVVTEALASDSIYLFHIENPCRPAQFPLKMAATN